MDTLEMKDIEAAVEGILFASGEPVAVDRICVALNMDRPTVELVLQHLQDYYSYERRGVRLLRMEDSWQLCSAPEYGDQIRKAFEIRKTAKLSQPALEVLTIIAYYQPTTRAYIDQMWAEAMEIYRSGKCQLRLPKEMEKELCEYQKQFMQEDTKKELILDYLEHYEGSMVCSRQLYSEALGNDGNPAQWEIREINDIMNNCSDWIAFSNPRHFPEPYRRQKGWEKPDNRGQDFQPITKEQMEQLSLPPEWMER